jgi:hypothetical protein
MRNPHIISLAPRRDGARSAALDSLLAGGLSMLALLWRGRSDSTPAAPLNAAMHWFFPQRALQRDDASLAYTGGGAAVHLASASLWGAVYAWLRRQRQAPTVTNAVTDAAAVTAVAALVDLKLVPPRLTPGFEHRLSKRSLWWVYGTFAVGLAIGGVLTARR